MTNHIIQLKLKKIRFKKEGEKREEILQEKDQIASKEAWAGTCNMS